MCPLRGKIKQFYALGDLKKVPIKVQTDTGPQQSTLNGQILFSIGRQATGTELHLQQLNLTAESVKCEKGASGLLSLGFIRGSAKTTYSKDGKFQTVFKMNLHYPLITKIHGYRPQKEKEQDNFVPYVDTVRGTLKGEFKPPLETISEDIDLDKERHKLELKLAADFTSETKKYYINALDFQITTPIMIKVVFRNSLKVQPVFIRSGPTDTSPTGWSFDTMMQSAKCQWRKCCVYFNVLAPIYVDDASFKEISSQSQAQNLLGKVNVSDAVEVFVADHMTTAMYTNWGGGATFDSGTANAKIVTCDAQLKVPDPAGGFQGAVNVNHLAHELGHVISLSHPGTTPSPPMVAATPNTIMEPSGFYKDNPHAQSQFNCDHVASPLFITLLELYDYRCRQNPEL